MRRSMVWTVLFLQMLLCACRPRVETHPLNFPQYPERHTTTTDDGWQLALHHYPACFRGKTQEGCTVEKKREPVILCHGLACNRFTFDLNEERSMARYLADRGYDVWMLELRGHGESPRKKGKKAMRDGFGMDEYALHDVPAALQYVTQQTGAAQVNWVGHSMGGMILYMYLSTTGDPRLRNVVTMGSPGSFDYPSRLVGSALKATRYAMALPRINVPLYSRPVARVTSRLLGFEEVGLNTENLSKPATREVLWLWFAPIERGVERSFVSIRDAGRLVSRDGQTDYSARLSEFKVPLLAIAGRVDALAPPYNVLQVFEKVGSTDRTFELASRTNGYHADYGHADLMVGDNAKADLYPLVYRWLESRQPGE